MKGVHAIVDGQFGSTGKGLAASWMARQAVSEGQPFEMAITNSGPNSGHTFYHNGNKHVLKQLPTVAVKTALLGGGVCLAILDAGAIIDPKILCAEAARYPGVPILVNPRAAVITDADRGAEHSGSVAAVAGTRSGTGAALARKVLRDPTAIIGAGDYDFPPNVSICEAPTPRDSKVALEVSQGFSLGLHSSFYPKVTSRECTVAQGLADARLPPSALRHTTMVIRTFPIRVGNVDGYSSGEGYYDQKETTWAAIGVAPEYTTVTNRQRRVFTFSLEQFKDAVAANDPDEIFVNFMNYLRPDRRMPFLLRIGAAAPHATYLLGFGPNDEDVRPS